MNEGSGPSTRGNFEVVDDRFRHGEEEVDTLGRRVQRGQGNRRYGAGEAVYRGTNKSVKHWGRGVTVVGERRLTSWDRILFFFMEWKALTDGSFADRVSNAPTRHHRWFLINVGGLIYNQLRF